jgi:hypothetical protein
MKLQLDECYDGFDIIIDNKSCGGWNHNDPSMRELFEELARKIGAEFVYNEVY